jgi:hypothetical protein
LAYDKKTTQGISAFEIEGEDFDAVAPIEPIVFKEPEVKEVNTPVKVNNLTGLFKKKTPAASTTPTETPVAASVQSPTNPPVAVVAEDGRLGNFCSTFDVIKQMQEEPDITQVVCKEVMHYAILNDKGVIQPETLVAAPLQLVIEEKASEVVEEVLPSVLPVLDAESVSNENIRGYTADVVIVDEAANFSESTGDVLDKIHGKGKRGRPAKEKVETTPTSELLQRVAEIVQQPDVADIPTIYTSGVSDEDTNTIKEFISSVREESPTSDEEIAEAVGDFSISTEEMKALTINGPGYASGAVGVDIIKEEAWVKAMAEKEANADVSAGILKFDAPIVLGESKKEVVLQDPKIDEFKRRIELNNYAKSQLTPEMKTELANYQAKETTENLTKINETLNDLKLIMKAASKPLDEWTDLLDAIRNLKSDPLPSQPTPDEMIDGLVHLNACIERISDGYSDLCRINSIYKESTDLLEKMWSVISLQGNETARKGDLLIQLNDLVPYKVQLNALMVAFEVEMGLIKQQQFVYQALINLTELKIKGLNDPCIKGGDGINY